MPRTRRRCPPADDDLVRTLPPKDAAERIGRPVAAVYHRRHKLEAAARKRAWTPAEDALLMRFPPEVAAERLGRTLDAVMTRLWRLGLMHRA
ncbi:MAG: hypothetical protein J2P46_19180 [Zavarzinella sp.]|nr:hypothetical protein [Zavarzinella sp.]